MTAATRDTDDAMCAINVMYDVGKIFSAGGASDYDASTGWTSAHITTIGSPYTAATVERVTNMTCESPIRSIENIELISVIRRTSIWQWCCVA